MVKLLETDIRSRDVLDWTGIHLFHYESSSCSEKVRICLREKSIEWVSHPIALHKNENYSDWYLGINPRGLVPTLVHDGDVHIESNDIIAYLEQTYPEPKLIPSRHRNKVEALLREEDSMHLDLRTLTFGLRGFGRSGPVKSKQVLAKYRGGGSGTVAGVNDKQRLVEFDFWRNEAKHGITESQIVNSAARFQSVLSRWNDHLGNDEYLSGPTAGVVDIAWFVIVNRLISIGYPMSELHPAVYAWFEKLGTRRSWLEELRGRDQIPDQDSQAHKGRQEREIRFRAITGF